MKSFSGYNIVFGMDSSVIVSTDVTMPYASPSLHAKQVTISTVDGLSELSAEEFVEPILQENPNRFTLFPIMKPNLFQKYKNHVSVFWTTEEIDLAKDMKAWEKLTPNEQPFIKITRN